ncbi:MAG: GAF domain-containing protein [Myxococcaceae bacterium]
MSEVPKPVVITLGVALGDLTPEDVSHFRVCPASNEDDLFQRLENEAVVAIVLGEPCAGPAAVGLLERIRARRAEREPASIVLAGGPQLSIFQELVDDDRIFFLSQAPLSKADNLLVVRGAIARQREALAPAAPVTASDESQVAKLRRILEFTDRVMLQQSPKAVCGLAAQMMPRLLQAARAYCLVYDASHQTLWTKEASSDDRRSQSAAVGLASFVVRTGASVSVKIAGEDPRYDREADDPNGVGNESLLLQPVFSSEGSVIAVLILVRLNERAAFTSEDGEALRRVAEHLEPALSHVLLKASLDEASRLRAGVVLPGGARYREEAREYHASGQSVPGAVLRTSERWFRWTAWLVLAVALSTLTFGGLVHVDSYVTGPALVRLDACGGRGRVIALLPGRARPLLEPGLMLRFELEGYGVLKTGPVDTVYEGLVSRERLPEVMGSTMPDESRIGMGPWTVVTAPLGAPGFRHGPRNLEVVDGMNGNVQVRVGTETLLQSMLPRLSSWLERGHG